MRKIVDYKNVKDVNLKVLDKIVSEELKSDWQPFGGVVVNNNVGTYGINTTFVQTLVKYED